MLGFVRKAEEKLIGAGLGHPTKLPSGGGLSTKVLYVLQRGTTANKRHIGRVRYK